MLKHTELRKLKNAKLLAVANKMVSTLSAGSWSSEFDSYLKRLEEQTAQFLQAQVDIDTAVEHPQVAAAQQSCKRYYRKLYLHLKPLLLSDDEK